MKFINAKNHNAKLFLFTALFIATFHSIYTIKSTSINISSRYFSAKTLSIIPNRFLNHDSAQIDYINPLSINRFAYVQNRPLYYVDPDGRYSMETGAVEAGDTLSGITNQLNDFYGTNFNYNQIAQVNGVSNPNLINIGQTIKIGTMGANGRVWQPPVDPGVVNVAYWRSLTNTQQQILHYHRNFYNVTPPSLEWAQTNWNLQSGWASKYHRVGPGNRSGRAHV